MNTLLIFSPPSDREFVNDLKNSLSPLKVITDAEIEESMKENSFEELLPFEFSLLSQELSYLSDLFIYSEISSWSGNVHMERFTDGRSENYSNIYLAMSSIPDNNLKTSLWRANDLVAKYQQKSRGISGAN